MRTGIAIIGLLIGSVSTAAFTQSQATLPPSSGAPDNGSSNVGGRATTTNPADELTKRQGLQDVSADHGRPQSTNPGAARPAKPNELTAGATVKDKSGVAMATIVSVDTDGVVVSTATGKIKIPTDAIGHNKGGLLLDMTKAQFDQVVAKANTAS